MKKSLKAKFSINLKSKRFKKIKAKTKSKCKRGGMTNKLLDIGDIEEKDVKGPVIRATIEGNADTLSKLIEMKADHNRREGSGVNTDGFTAAHYAAEKGDAKYLKLLINAGAKLNILGRHKEYRERLSPMHLAAEKGHTECLQMLIDAGANPSIVETNPKMYDGHGDLMGLTPALLAAENGHANCLALLHEAGADLGMANSSSGFTPAHCAVNNGDYNCLKVLLKAGVGVCMKVDSRGRTPAHLACITWYNGRLPEGGADAHSIHMHNLRLTGHHICLKMLINAGAALDVIDEDGCTPLHYAASWGKISCLQLLINADAPLNIVDKYHGWTPVHYAVIGNDRDDIYVNKVKCLELLKNAGADLEIASFTGKTPAQYAKEKEKGNDKYLDILPKETWLQSGRKIATKMWT